MLHSITARPNKLITILTNRKLDFCSI